MDRDALVERNKLMAEAFHTKSPRHKLRHELFSNLSQLPISPQRNQSNKILFIRPDHIGDVLLSTPAIRAMSAANPNAQIHALVGSWGASILEPFDEIDQILTLPFPGFERDKSKSNLLAPYWQLVKSALNLRKIGYSKAIILRPDHWWGAALAFLAGIPERIGYALPEVEPFLTQSIPHQQIHAVKQSLLLIEKWTGELSADDILYDFPVNDQDAIYVDGLLQKHDISPKQSILCIHPGAGTWVKRWTNPEWASIADTLTEQYDVKTVITGSAGESDLAKEITANMRHQPLVLCGDLNLLQLAALYQRAQVVLGADSGPLHIAAAVHTPTVALFGPADPVEFRPYGNPQRHILLGSSIACRPCRVLDWAGDDPENHPCVRDITIAQVLEAARTILNML